MFWVQVLVSSLGIKVVWLLLFWEVVDGVSDGELEECALASVPISASVSVSLRVFDLPFSRDSESKIVSVFVAYFPVDLWCVADPFLL